MVEPVQRLRTYTVDEANNELPRVRRIVSQIAELSALLPELEDQARIAEYQSKRPGAAADNRDRHQQARDAVSEELIDHECQKQGSEESKDQKHGAAPQLA